MKRLSFLIMGGLLLAACAGYSIRDEQSGKQGYVVYEPWPHILRSATTSNAGRLTGYKFQVVYLPNRARPYRVRSWSGLGKADFQFNFQDGWMLTGLHDKGDNTGVLEALSALVPTLPGLENAGGVPQVEPVLYRMEFDSCGRVSGLTPILTSGKHV